MLIVIMYIWHIYLYQNCKKMLVRQTTDLKENLKRKYIFILGHQKERQDEMTNI